MESLVRQIKFPMREYALSEPVLESSNALPGHVKQTEDKVVSGVAQYSPNPPIHPTLEITQYYTSHSEV